MRSAAACRASRTPHKQSGTFSQKTLELHCLKPVSQKQTVMKIEIRSCIRQTQHLTGGLAYSAELQKNCSPKLIWQDKQDLRHSALSSWLNRRCWQIYNGEPNPQIDNHVLCLGLDGLQYTPKPLNQQLRGVYGDAFWQVCFINKPCLESELS